MLPPPLSSSVSTTRWATLLHTHIMKGKDHNFFGKENFFKRPQLISYVSQVYIGHETSIIGLEAHLGIKYWYMDSVRIDTN